MVETFARLARWNLSNAIRYSDHVDIPEKQFSELFLFLRPILGVTAKSEHIQIYHQPQSLF
jgi:hypothetical protein